VRKMAEKDLPAWGEFELKDVTSLDLPEDFSVFHCSDPEIIRLEFYRKYQDLENLKKYYWSQRRDPATLIFLNFDRVCNLHQLMGEEGDKARQTIIDALKKRFIKVVKEQFQHLPPGHLVLNLIDDSEGLITVRICTSPQEDFYKPDDLFDIFNNGEVVIWWPGIRLKEELIFKILKDLKHSLDKDRIKVKIKEKEYEVLFNGWGFRYE